MRDDARTLRAARPTTTHLAAVAVALLVTAVTPLAAADGPPLGCVARVAERCGVEVTILGRVLHVDNTAPPNGDGTAAHPFRSLRRATRASMPGDVFRVHRGDGTTAGLDRGIVLRDGQCLLGEGGPVITHQEGPVVTLASHNVVAGLTIVGVDAPVGRCPLALAADGSGVYGEGNESFFVADNSFAGGCFGVLAEGAVGGGTVACNRFEEAPVGIAATAAGDGFLDLNVEGNRLHRGLGGVVLDAPAGSELVARVAGNRVAEHYVAVAVGSELTGPTAGRVRLRAIDNTVVDGVHREGEPPVAFEVDLGVAADPEGGGAPELELEVRGNVVRDQVAVDVGVDAGTARVLVAGNRFERLLGDGVELDAQGTGVGMRIEVSDNLFVDAAGEALVVEVDEGVAEALVTRNTFDGFGADAVDLEAEGGGLLLARCLANRFIGSGGDGAGIDVGIAKPDAAAVVEIVGNQMADANAGVVLGAVEGAALVATVTANLITGNRVAGIGLLLDPGGPEGPQVQARVRDNVLLGNGEAPMGLLARVPVGNLCLALHDNLSDTDFLLEQEDPGSFLLELSPEGNRGEVVTDGEVVPVPFGSCGGR